MYVFFFNEPAKLRTYLINTHSLFLYLGLEVRKRIEVERVEGGEGRRECWVKGIA